MSEKICKETGAIIPSGRSDKKYANDKARSMHHNRIRRKSVHVYKKTDKQLHKNHEILEKYYNETKGEKGINLSFLKAVGFDPRVYLGTPMGPEFEDRPNEYYSYEYKYTYDKESKKITIKKIQRPLMSRY
jgi:hypothetical protein